MKLKIVFALALTTPFYVSPVFATERDVLMKRIDTLETGVDYLYGQGKTFRASFKGRLANLKKDKKGMVSVDQFFETERLNNKEFLRIYMEAKVLQNDTLALMQDGSRELGFGTQQSGEQGSISGRLSAAMQSLDCIMFTIKIVSDNHGRKEASDLADTVSNGCNKIIQLKREEDRK